jgi:hypothetical protein
MTESGSDGFSQHFRGRARGPCNEFSIV